MNPYLIVLIVAICVGSSASALARDEPTDMNASLRALELSASYIHMSNGMPCVITYRRDINDNFMALSCDWDWEQREMRKAVTFHDYHNLPKQKQKTGNPLMGGDLTEINNDR